MDLYFTLKIPSFVFFLFQIEAILRSISTAKIRQIWYYGMKCHVLWNNADFFFLNILPNKNNGALGNLWHIPHLLHSKSTKKNTKKELEEVNFSSFWHMIQQFLSQKFLLITEKGIYFWHSVNIMISMFGLFLLSHYLKGYSYSRHENLP